MGRTLISEAGVPLDMRKRIKQIVRRSKYAATGAAIGAAVGAVFGRNAASTGGAIGALAGATIADQRSSVDSIVGEIREKRADDKLATDSD